MLRILRSLPSFRSGIAYVHGGRLYLSPTARSPYAANTMRSCRGPQFASRDAALAPRTTSNKEEDKEEEEDTGFDPLVLPADGSKDPTAEELATLVDDYYAATATETGTNMGSMGEKDGGVVFQGNGDPLAATQVVVDTVRLVAQRRNGIAFRLNTLGLCQPEDVDVLLSSDVLTRSADDKRRETRIDTVSVFLPAANPQQYATLLQPHNGAQGFSDVCSFVVRLAEAGVRVECTAVAGRPDVRVAEVEALAKSLGATSFRTREWLG